ncbi:MAG: hypothetical protein JWL84_2127 [Rhodospirillales bacterium]|nr:hypothetical protein [Rhodospirillales bacterium]
MIEIESPTLRRLYADWDARRRGRKLPARPDFDPLELKYILGNLSLVDVQYDPLRFRYRLHATNVAQRLGYELTGKPLAANPDVATREIIETHFQAVVASRIPQAIVHRFFTPEGRAVNHEALVLPLSRDGIRIDMLMSAVAFF